MNYQSRDKDYAIDAVMYSTLFYLLSQKDVYERTQNILKFVKDRAIIHAIVFGIVYILIQKMTKRM
jgi:hypothetical protein